MSNKIKLLYILTKTELSTNIHIINFLQSKGIEVITQPIRVINNYAAEMKQFKNIGFNKRHIFAKYDFILWATHSATSQEFRYFQKQVKPRVGFIDIEHDLFANDLPEHCLSYGKSLLVTFQKRHYENSIKLLSENRKIINAKWPKLSIYYPPLLIDKEIDRWNDVILIGTGIWNGIDIPLDGIFRSFNKVWYKKYVSDWFVNGIEMLPDQFNGPIGSKYCTDVCKFIITMGSSCYQDALLFGSIPILMPGTVTKETIINDIISMVEVKPWVFPDIEPFKAITTNNLEEKLSYLKYDYDLYKKIHRELFLEWFDSDYYSLPTAHNIIYDFIKETA